MSHKQALINALAEIERSHTPIYLKGSAIKASDFIRVYRKEELLPLFNAAYPPEEKIDLTEEKGESILHMAARAGCADIVKAFIERDVDTSILNHQQKTAAMIALENFKNAKANNYVLLDNFYATLRFLVPPSDPRDLCYIGDLFFTGSAWINKNRSYAYHFYYESFLARLEEGVPALEQNYLDGIINLVGLDGEKPSVAEAMQLLSKKVSSEGVIETKADTQRPITCAADLLLREALNSDFIKECCFAYLQERTKHEKINRDSKHTASITSYEAELYVIIQWDMEYTQWTKKTGNEMSYDERTTLFNKIVHISKTSLHENLRIACLQRRLDLAAYYASKPTTDDYAQRAEFHYTNLMLDGNPTAIKWLMNAKHNESYDRTSLLSFLNALHEPANRQNIDKLLDSLHKESTSFEINNTAGVLYSFYYYYLKDHDGKEIIARIFNKYKNDSIAILLTAVNSYNTRNDGIKKLVYKKIKDGVDKIVKTLSPGTQDALKQRLRLELFTSEEKETKSVDPKQLKIRADQINAVYNDQPKDFSSAQQHLRTIESYVNAYLAHLNKQTTTSEIKEEIDQYTFSLRCAKFEHYKKLHSNHIAENKEYLAENAENKMRRAFIEIQGSYFETKSPSIKKSAARVLLEIMQDDTTHLKHIPLCTKLALEGSPIAITILRDHHGRKDNKVVLLVRFLNAWHNINNEKYGVDKAFIGTRECSPDLKDFYLFCLQPGNRLSINTLIAKVNSHNTLTNNPILIVLAAFEIYASTKQLDDITAEKIKKLVHNSLETLIDNKINNSQGHLFEIGVLVQGQKSTLIAEAIANDAILDAEEEYGEIDEQFSSESTAMPMAIILPSTHLNSPIHAGKTKKEQNKKPEAKHQPSNNPDNSSIKHTP